MLRADHVGSLLRPDELLRTRNEHSAGTISLEQLRQAEDDAILVALELQRQAGLEIFSDGEFRRGTWLGDMAEAVEGFVPASVSLEWHGPGGGTEPSTSYVVGAKLRQTRRLTGHEAGFLKDHAPGPFKMTMPAPSVFMLSSYRPGTTDAVYATRTDLLRDVSAIVKGEIEALIAEGCSYVQLDDAFMSWYVDPVLREQLKSSGGDPDESLRQGIAANNASLAGVDHERVTIGLHICRGNSKSRWFAEGGYDAIAEQLFTESQADRFLLEYDDQRSGSFAPLRFLPPGKVAVLGLVSSKVAALEREDELRRRIDEAGTYAPLDQLALSPQCGFASVAAGNAISQDDQSRKLELVVEVARKVWG